jgi:hypothetical protein
MHVVSSAAIVCPGCETILLHAPHIIPRISNMPDYCAFFKIWYLAEGTVSKTTLLGPPGELICHERNV